MRVLLAVDGSECSDTAVKEIASRPWPAGTEIKIVSAFQIPLTPTPEAWAIPDDYYEQMEQSVGGHAQAVVDLATRALAKDPDTSVHVESEVLPGSPRAAILEEADRWNADLIVVGSHGYGAWQRFLLGSVSQAVVSHAKCSVEVVRCRPAAGAVEKKAA